MGEHEIVGFCQKLANLATNLAQTKANGKPRARYSSQARPNDDLSCRLFRNYRFLRFAAFDGLNLGLKCAFYSLDFKKFRRLNLPKNRLVKSYV